MTALRFSLAAAVNNRRTLEGNLLRSPEVRRGSFSDILVQEGYTSASRAYNDALDHAKEDIVAFIHQDVYLPDGWLRSVGDAISGLDRAGVRWGVLGAFGSRHDCFGGAGRVYTNGLGMHGCPIARPEPVDTLDEIVLILRRSNGLRFDDALPHFHLYGTDICLAAAQAGFHSLAIQAFCIHNTHQLTELPQEFYACYRHVKRKWSNRLPIATSCLTISRFDTELLRKRAAEAMSRFRLRSVPVGKRRVDDPTSLLPDGAWRQFGAGSQWPVHDKAGASSRQSTQR